jgi:hypothetical protein
MTERASDIVFYGAMPCSMVEWYECPSSEWKMKPETAGSLEISILKDMTSHLNTANLILS